MNAAPREHREPVDRFAPGTGFELSTDFGPVVERIVDRAGPGLACLILSGSHATGEAVWAEREGRRVSLSDLDLYAVMRDEAAAAAARASAVARPLFSASERLAWGLLAPIEVAFETPAGIARMPARPGTVELARSARVLAGDAGVLARLPRWEPAAIPAEERLLLLENRAFELLWAHLPGAAVSERARSDARLRAHHAVLKVALDLAAVRTLARGELPSTAEERVARAGECGAPEGTTSWLVGAWSGLPAAWSEALEWRRAGARPVPEAAHVATRRITVRAWCAAWWAEGSGPGVPADPWDRALALAARGSLARRLRRSIAFRSRTGGGPGFMERLRRAAAGTPPHRIHGSAAVLLLAAAQAADEPRLPAGALHALRTLGITAADTFAAAARETFLAWDRQLHAGDREGDAANVGDAGAMGNVADAADRA